MTKTANWMMVATFTLALPACSAETSEDRAFGTVSMRLSLEEADVVGTDAGVEAQAGPLAVEHALAYVRHIEFYYPSDHCDEDEDEEASGDAGGCSDKLRVEGPWVINLETGEATPSMDAIEVPAGTYRRVDVRFEDSDDKRKGDLEIPEELAGWTLVAGGTYRGDLANTFDAMLKFNNDARFESKDGISVSSNGAREMVLALDVESWFDRASLEGCMARGQLEIADGHLVLEDEKRRCNDAENDIKRAMKHPGKLKG